MDQANGLLSGMPPSTDSLTFSLELRNPGYKVSIGDEEWQGDFLGQLELTQAPSVRNGFQSRVLFIADFYVYFQSCDTLHIVENDTFLCRRDGASWSWNLY